MLIKKVQGELLGGTVNCISVSEGIIPDLNIFVSGWQNFPTHGLGIHFRKLVVFRARTPVDQNSPHQPSISLSLVLGGICR